MTEDIALSPMHFSRLGCKLRFVGKLATGRALRFEAVKDTTEPVMAQVAETGLAYLLADIPKANRS